MYYIQNVQLKKFKDGKADLKDLNPRLQDKEELVRLAVRRGGSIQFKYASDRLRNDGSFILELVEKNPVILKFVKEPVRQNYIANLDGRILPDDKVPTPGKTMLVSSIIKLFGALCIEKNKDCAVYMSDYLAQEFLEYALSGGSATVELYSKTVKLPAYDKEDRLIAEMLHKRPAIAEALAKKGYTLPSQKGNDDREIEIQ